MVRNSNFIIITTIIVIINSYNNNNISNNNYICSSIHIQEKYIVGTENVRIL